MSVRLKGGRTVRARFTPAEYTVPLDRIANMRSGNEHYGSRELFTQGPDSPFTGLMRLRELSRDGKTFAVCINLTSPNFALEIELTDGELGEIYALPPEEAWQLHRERDATLNPPTAVED